jgi:uncharacterized protein YdeI (YjbR/CyaY-like superfamily)
MTFAIAALHLLRNTRPSTRSPYCFSIVKNSTFMSEELIILEFTSAKMWNAWVTKNHAKSPGVWVRLGRKGCSRPLMQHPQGLEVALCWGWIDATRNGESEETWLQRFTPRGKKSIWSKINRAKALALIEEGRMEAAGLQEVERAQADGRWEAAYDSHRTSTVPEDFEKALSESAAAREFFGTLNAANRYALLWRLQTTKTVITRKKKIGLFIGMLERKETFHP